MSFILSESEYLSFQLRLRKLFDVVPRTAPQPISSDELIRQFRLLLIDIDGTLIENGVVIPQMRSLLTQAKASGVAISFLSNSPAPRFARLQEMIPEIMQGLSEKNVVVSRHPLIDYLPQFDGKMVGIIANNSEWAKALPLRHYIDLCEFPRRFCDCDSLLVVGMKRWREELPSELLSAIPGKHIDFIVPNPDIAVPSEDGPLAETGTGAFLIYDTLGISPQFLGKPQPDIFRRAIEAAGPGHSPETTAVVGDNLAADILGGLLAGCATVHVPTGFGAFKNIDQHRETLGVFPDYLLQY